MSKADNFKDFFSDVRATINRYNIAIFFKKCSKCVVNFRTVGLLDRFANLYFPFIRINFLQLISQFMCAKKLFK